MAGKVDHPDNETRLNHDEAIGWLVGQYGFDIRVARILVYTVEELDGSVVYNHKVEIIAANGRYIIRDAQR